MLSNAYFIAKFRFDTAENEPAKNLQKIGKNAFFERAFFENAFSKNSFFENAFFENDAAGAGSGGGHAASSAVE